MTTDEIFGETAAAMFFRFSMEQKEKRWKEDRWDVEINRSRGQVQITTPENIVGSFEFGYSKNEDKERIRMTNADDINRDLLTGLNNFEINFLFTRDFRVPFKKMVREVSKELSEKIKAATLPLVLENKEYLEKRGIYSDGNYL